MKQSRLMGSSYFLIKLLFLCVRAPKIGDISKAYKRITFVYPHVSAPKTAPSSKALTKENGISNMLIR